MFRSHHITLILARERRLDLVRLGASVHVPRFPAPQHKRAMKDRFVEPSRPDVASEHDELQIGSSDPTPTPSPRKATVRVWRRAGEPRFAARSAAAPPADRADRELDRV
jgi:hypothetical protein